MKRAIIGLAVAASFASAPVVAADKELRIGYINTFSGPAAILGKHQRDGWALAIEHLGGKIGGMDTKITYGDDKVKPDEGIKAADRMLKQDKVHIISGILWSHVLLALQKRVTRSKVFLITTNAGASPMSGKLCNPYFFSTSWNNDQNAEVTGMLVNREGVKNAFLMAPNYQAGKDNVSGFKRTFKGKVLGQKLTRINQKDYAAEISLVRAADPEALWVFLPGPMGIAFMKQWASSGLKGKIKLYGTFTTTWANLKAIGKDAVGTFHTNYWTPDLDIPANKKFVADFRKKFGYMPSHFSAQAYDAPLLIDSAVRAVNGNLSDHDGLRNALRKANFDSTRGKFRYNRNHIPIQNFYKQEVVLDDKGQATIVTRGVVVKDYADSYVGQCKMKW